MPYLPIVTVQREGGRYLLGRNTSNPIRVYPDRWIEDDIAAKFTGKKRRERVSRREFRSLVRAAKGKPSPGWIV